VSFRPRRKDLIRNISQNNVIHQPHHSRDLLQSELAGLGKSKPPLHSKATEREGAM
jgi:hypothetical protein